MHTQRQTNRFVMQRFPLNVKPLSELWLRYMCVLVCVCMGYSPWLFQRMLHSQETGVTQSGQLLHPFFQRINDLVLLKFLILINHLLIKHKHCHFLEGQRQQLTLTLFSPTETPGVGISQLTSTSAQAQSVVHPCKSKLLRIGHGLVKGRLTHTHTHLFGGLLGAIVDPPAQARTPTGNMSSNLKLPCHWVAHDSAGDIRRHLCDGAF